MTLNIAMIATGGIADGQLAPALTAAEGAQLWSVLSRDKDRAAAFARKHGAAASDPAHDDLDALLADPDLDAVLIASPDKLHGDQAVAAARAGKHILCEKPMATDRDGGAAMVKAAEDAGVVLAVAYHLRWHMGHRAMQQKISSGAMGTPRHMRIMWPMTASNAEGWRAKTEVGKWWSLAGVGTHCLDQILWFMGPTCGEITRFESIINRQGFGAENDETALLAMQFENGSTAELCSSVLFPAPKRMEVFCADDYAIFHETLGPHGEGEITTIDGPFSYEPANPYVGEIEDFVRAVRDGNAPEVDGKAGLENVDLLLKAIGE